MQPATKIVLSIGAVAAAIVAALVLLGPEPEREAWATIENVCVDCHNDSDLAGEVTFSGMSNESVAEHPEIFESVVQKLRGRFMPPPGSPQPEQAEIDALVGWIEDSLDAAAGTEVGHVQAQRLSRTEYAHAVEALLGVSIDPAEYLPTEIEVDGFTNIAALGLADLHRAVR